TQYQLAVNHLDQGVNLCEQGNGGLGLLKLTEGLAKAPDDADDLQRVIRANLSGWPDRLSTLNAFLVHGGEVLAAAYSPDGRTVLTGGADGAARLWDARTGEALRAFRHESKVLAVAYSPDGQIVATGGADGTARLWDMRTREAAGLPLKHDSEVRAVAFSPARPAALTGGAA